MADYNVTVSLGGSPSGSSSGYNVKSYGAIADGTTSASTAFQAALSAIAAAGTGELIVPAGTYYIGTLITLPDACDLTITGDNAVLTGKDTTGECFRFEAGAVTPAAHGRVHIRGLEIKQFTDWCIRATTDSPGVYSTIESLEIEHCYLHDSGGGIAMYANMTTSSIHDNEIANIDASTTGTQGVRLGTADTATTFSTGEYFIHDNYIHDIENTGAGYEAQGILVYGSYASIHHNHLHDIKNSGDGTNSEGIYTKCVYADVSFNKLENAGTSSNGMICLKGANRSGGTASYGYGSLVKANTIVSTGTDSNSLQYGIFTAVEDTTIEDNQIEGIYKVAIGTTSEDTSNLVVRGNRITRHRGAFVMYFIHSGTGLYVKDNEIVDALYGVSAADAYGIYVIPSDDADLNNVFIENNSVILTASTGSTTHARGIVVRPASAPNGRAMQYLKVRGNSVIITATGSSDTNPIRVAPDTYAFNDVVVTGNSCISASNSYVSKGTGGGLRWMIDISGTGSPEASISADIGSRYTRTDGTGQTAQYTKSTGTGNTGWTCGGNVVATAAADDTSPSVAGVRWLLIPANTVATAITQLDDGVAYQVVTLIATSATNPSTITDSGNFKLSAAWSPGVDDTLTLFTVDGTTWREVSRSDN